MTVGAAELLKSVGLMADGPVVWGRPVGARRGGVFIVELTEPRPTAPIELTVIGKWLERVPDLLLDGAMPTSRALAARLSAFWLPSARVLYVGSTDGSIGGRVEAIRATVLGERRPYSGGHWLHALSSLEKTRIWWATTDAAEEYEDALLDAFAASVPAEERSKLPDTQVVLPFANLRTASGVRKATGLANSLVAAEPAKPAASTRVVEVPPGAADGAGGLPTRRAAGGTVRRAPRPVAAKAPATTPAPRPTTARNRPSTAEPTWISADGLARLQAEHTELTKVRRPEVIGRIKSAKELGDLKENADYTAAREEQSFLEGRIATIEALLRTAVVIDAPGVDGRVRVGSSASVEEIGGDGATVVYEIVGTAEADPAGGRISNVSPVGRALIGRSVGDVVTVTTPRGPVEYRIVAVE